MNIDAISIGIPAAILLCYALGVLILRAGIRDIRLGRGARSWPTIDARLERCVVEKRSTSKGAVYQLSVRYSYVLAGVRYPGDNLAIGYGASGNREAHEEAQRRVLAMPRFVVRYHPRQPETSTVFPAENALIFGTAVFGLGWLAFTTCFALLALAISGVGRALLDWLGR